MQTSHSTRSPSSISYHEDTSENPTAEYNLIFMITGNPGLVSYYTAFLSTLNQLFTSKKSPESDIFHVYGQSLAGFEQNDRPSPATSVPYSLNDQIEILVQALKDRSIPTGARKGQAYDGITLLGHSVGAFIVMEILTRLRKSGSSLKVKGSIMLFPTVTHIAKSPSGVKFNTLFNVPGFPKAVSVVGKILLWPISRTMLTWVIGRVLGMPEDAAETTTNFLKSDMGIWQALDELASITEDKWDDQLWGVASNDAGDKTQALSLVFYFGEEDHWVASHFRDELITTRGRREGEVSSMKPLMLIDKNKTPHGFCINHSEQIAEKVKVWIDESLGL